MTFGEKLKEIRRRFSLSQEQLAEIMNVSRQAITKWENDKGLPDVGNLQHLAKTFGLSVDSLLNDQSHLPLLVMKMQIDKNKYKNKFSSYAEILNEFFGESYEIFVLSREKKMNIIEFLIDVFVGGSAPAMIYPIETADVLSDLSPYYLIKKDNLKLLVNIKNWVLEVVELPVDTDDKKFIYQKNRFRNCGKLDLSKQKER